MEVKDEGLSVWDKVTEKEAMAHAMNRIVYLATISHDPLIGVYTCLAVPTRALTPPLPSSALALSSGCCAALPPHCFPTRD